MVQSKEAKQQHTANTHSNQIIAVFQSKANNR